MWRIVQNRPPFILILQQRVRTIQWPVSIFFASPANKSKSSSSRFCLNRCRFSDGPLYCLSNACSPMCSLLWTRIFAMKTLKWLILLSFSLAIPILLVRFVRKQGEPSDPDRRYDINDYLTEVGLWSQCLPEKFDDHLSISQRLTRRRLEFGRYSRL